jgi:hypothetical protein
MGGLSVRVPGKRGKGHASTSHVMEALDRMTCDKVTKVEINSDMVDSERNGPMRKSKNRDTILKIKEKLSEDDNRSGNSTDMEESIPTKQPRKRKKAGNTVEQVRDEAIRMKTTHRATCREK